MLRYHVIYQTIGGEKLLQNMVGDLINCVVIIKLFRVYADHSVKWSQHTDGNLQIWRLCMKLGTKKDSKTESTFFIGGGGVKL